MDTQERILTKAEELYTRYGIRSVSMDDVARDLSISKKTIYQFFRDKDDLVKQVLRYHFTDKKCRIDEITQQTEDALDELLRMTEHIREEMTRTAPSLVYDLRKYHPKAWDEYKTFKLETILKTIVTNIRRGQREGLFRTDMDPEVIARLRLEQVESAFDPEIFPPDQFALPEVQHQAIMHFIRGMLSKQGFDLLEQRLEKIKTLST